MNSNHYWAQVWFQPLNITLYLLFYNAKDAAHLDMWKDSGA